MTTTEHVPFGRETDVRYLLLSVALGVVVLALKFVGYTLGGPQILFSGILAVALLVLVTSTLAVKYSKENGGLLTAILVVFLPALAEREFDIVLGVGHPNPGVVYGAGLALAFAVPVGTVAYLLGQRL